MKRTIHHANMIGFTHRSIRRLVVGHSISPKYLFVASWITVFPSIASFLRLFARIDRKRAADHDRLRLVCVCETIPGLKHIVYERNIYAFVVSSCTYNIYLAHNTRFNSTSTYAASELRRQLHSGTRTEDKFAIRDGSFENPCVSRETVDWYRVSGLIHSIFSMFKRTRDGIRREKWYENTMKRASVPVTSVAN